MKSAVSELIAALEAIAKIGEEGVIERRETGKPTWNALDAIKQIAQEAIDNANLIPCEQCHNGRWETECCSGANGCDCRGERVDMGACNVCGGTGMRRPDANTRANIEAIQGRCFIGRGPTSGYWANWENR